MGENHLGLVARWPVVFLDPCLNHLVTGEHHFCRAVSLAQPVLQASMAVGLGQTLVFHQLCLAAALCLPDGVPDMNLSYIKDVGGEDVEIKLVAYDWPSVEFVTALGKMMIQEASWYNMV